MILSLSRKAVRRVRKSKDRIATNQRFTVLSMEAARQEPLETVSNSLADTVLIKTVSANGDLESSQRRIGRPAETDMVSVVGRYLSFLPNIWGGRRGSRKGPKRPSRNEKRRASISRRPALTFWRFFRRKN